MDKDSLLQRLGSRLREERERLGKTQPDFGELGGVSKNSQIAYEQGRAAAGAEYFARIAEAGADIGYIMLGVRDGRPARASGYGVAEEPPRYGRDIASISERMRFATKLVDQVCDEVGVRPNPMLRIGLETISMLDGIRAHDLMVLLNGIKAQRNETR